LALARAATPLVWTPMAAPQAIAGSHRAEQKAAQKKLAISS
jgi:hypothetical protein